MLMKAERFEEAREALLHALAQFPITVSDDWYSSAMKRLLIQLAVRCRSTTETRSLLADATRTQRGPVVDRVRTRSLTADVWTDVALHYASGHRDDRRAAAAAALAILENPFKPMDRPGLVRLVARGWIGPRNGKTVRADADRSIAEGAVR
jgi:hypothetical protein